MRATAPMPANMFCSKFGSCSPAGLPDTFMAIKRRRTPAVSTKLNLDLARLTVSTSTLLLRSTTSTLLKKGSEEMNGLDGKFNSSATLLMSRSPTTLTVLSSEKLGSDDGSDLPPGKFSTAPLIVRPLEHFQLSVARVILAPLQPLE